MVTDLSKTKQYLAAQYGPKEGYTIVLVAALCLIAMTLGVRTLMSGAGSWLLIITVFGCGSTILAGIKRFASILSQRARKKLDLRPDLVELGRELQDLSESHSFEKRVEPDVARAMERAAETSLVTLNALRSNQKEQSENLADVEPSVHEAMHEVFALASPFIRRAGTRRSHFADKVANLDATGTVDQIEEITRKLTAVQVALTGSETLTLRLDQTLARLQELKQAESELDQSLSR